MATYFHIYNVQLLPVVACLIGIRATLVGAHCPMVAARNVGSKHQMIYSTDGAVQVADGVELVVGVKEEISGVVCCRVWVEHDDRCHPIACTGVSTVQHRQSAAVLDV